MTWRPAGDIEVVLVHSPDRLSRKYAYQVLLIEELGRHGVETRFLNAPSSATAEDQLLVQFQGMIAEYERAQILERSGRGKRHSPSRVPSGPRPSAWPDSLDAPARDGVVLVDVAHDARFGLDDDVRSRCIVSLPKITIAIRGAAHAGLHHSTHGVLKYWVVDRTTDTVTAHRQRDGVLEPTDTSTRRDTLRTVLLEGLDLQLEDVFPPEPNPHDRRAGHPEVMKRVTGRLFPSESRAVQTRVS